MCPERACLLSEPEPEVGVLAPSLRETQALVLSHTPAKQGSTVSMLSPGT